MSDTDNKEKQAAGWRYKLLGWLTAAMARLPMWALYGVADLLFVVLYHLAGYRRRVVRDNLAGSFPDKEAGELRRIERQFFRNFADYIVETLKLLHVTDREMRRRMTFSGVEVIDKALADGRPVVCYFAHIGNWEWAPSVSLHTAAKPGDVAFCQVYRPLKSESFDRLMLELRSRFGSVSIPKESTLRHLLRYRKDGMPSITGFMSDQHPSHGDPGHSTTLLGHPTRMISGTETLARKLDFAAVYWDMERTSRGHYRITTRLLAEHPAELPEGELTERYTRALEATVRRNPAIWLWSHKRWK